MGSMNFVMAARERRETVGLYASAALPVLWSALHRLGHTHADFARQVGVSTAQAARILYGDRGPGRRPAAICLRVYGVPPDLWEQPLPKRWKPHVRAPARPAA